MRNGEGGGEGEGEGEGRGEVRGERNKLMEGVREKGEIEKDGRKEGELMSQESQNIFSLLSSLLPPPPPLLKGVTIGFERPLYTAEEPANGVVPLQVCVSVMAGTLGRELQVVPEWREDTASGKEKKTCCCKEAKCDCS